MPASAEANAAKAITSAESARADSRRVVARLSLAHYTADAIEAGGLTLVRPVAAKDFGAALKTAAFLELPVSAYRLGYRAGDVAVIQPYAGGNPNGHMAMFDGKAWYSDFKQNSISCPADPYPGPGYRQASPPFKVYRRGETSG